MVGPDAGNRFALAEDTITASRAALTKNFELTASTKRFRSVSYATRIPFEKKKMQRLPIFSKTFTARSHDIFCGGAWLIFYKIDRPTRGLPSVGLGVTIPGGVIGGLPGVRH